VDINDTGTRHGVAAGDCPSVHTEHHHLAIISVLGPRLSTCIHHRRSAYVA
jgi:hypothetical protein